MPGTGVYFVNSASSALCAAALIASGVPKSGSPAPKSITSTPERRNLSTAAPTAIVADVAILDVRSANRAMTLLLSGAGRSGPRSGNPDRVALPLPQPLFDKFGDKP